MTEGETYSDLWMDNLIYATAIHASNHLCANGYLDGYVVLIVVLVFGADPMCCRMLNELLMRGLFDLEIPPEQSNCWMTHLTYYTATVGTELFSYVPAMVVIKEVLIVVIVTVVLVVMQEGSIVSLPVLLRCSMPTR